MDSSGKISINISPDNTDKLEMCKNDKLLKSIEKTVLKKVENEINKLEKSA